MTNSSLNSDRLHYMDNLRALVMTIGVFFHAALAYSPLTNPVWFTADTVNSVWVDVFSYFFHIFRMPLFFVIAGFFTALLINKRGLGAMLKNRLRRVALPFVIFWPLVIAGILAGLLWAIDSVENLSPILAFVKSVPDAPQTPLSTTHLWFLYYLCLFYALTSLLVWKPIAKVLSKLGNFILNLHPVIAMSILPLLLIPGLYSGSQPYPAPESFMPQFWAIAFFGSFFAYGYLLFRSEKVLQYFEQYWLILLVLSALLYCLFFMAMPDPILSDPANIQLLQQVTLVLTTAYIAVFMSVVGLVLAKKFLNQHNGLMRYLADASYWIYISHLPILFFVQYLLLDMEAGLLIKFSISCLATLTLCTLSYMLFVRATPIGWLLNGRRKKIFSLS